MILKTTQTLYIKVNNISENYPKELEEDIEDWLRSKAVELGIL